MHLNLTWASETAHAFDLARSFSDSAAANALPISYAFPLGDTTIFSPGIWVIFISTTGQGVPPYSMHSLWKNMMKKGYKIQSGVHFAIYSLGDRSYGDNFAMAGRKLRQRLRMLGAIELLQIGLGDDQDPQGYREVYQSGWVDQLFSILKEKIKPGIPQKLQLSMRNYKEESDLTVVKAQELSSRKGRKVVWVQTELKDSKLSQGDVLQIYPHNRREEVDYLLQHLCKTGTQIYSYLGMQLSLRTILSQHLNISSVLNYYFFSNQNTNKLIQCCSNPLHRAKLQEFCKDYQEFYHYIIQYKRNLVEFIKDFDISLSTQYILQYLGPIIPRKYSIARIKQQTAWLLVKIVDIQLTPTRYYQGLCSHDLLQPCTRKTKILKSQITLSTLKDHNLVITLGTGIAPFIWVIDQLKQQKILLLYTNSYSDELYHRKLCPPNQNLEEIVSCTREQGPKLLRLLQLNLQKIACFLSLPNRQIYYCGPKQIQTFLENTIASMFNTSKQTIRKQNLIIYQNW